MIARAFCRKATAIVQPLALLGLTVLSLGSQAQDATPSAQQQFATCLVGLKETALQQGISEQTTEQVLGQSRYLEAVIGYDRNQPEFVTTFPNYLSKRVNDWRINKGREKLEAHRPLLKKLTQQYGIPAQYLVAFWGLETNFGSYKGKMPIIDSLATLACDKRRSEFFTRELMQALTLLERESLAPEKMLGSWAGAMGHTQFMPSAYLAYAIDGDADGKVDLWESEEDALSSAANFLHTLGWRAGYRWGREVLLPDEFDYAQSGKDQRKPLQQWAALGVQQTSGEALPDSDIQASLLVPSGHKGPAFLVYSNFDVIMRWNNSESYAIAVGYLSDRILGKPALTQPLPELPDYAVTDVKVLQASLNTLGFEVGTADGILGPATRKGIREFQASRQMIADGFPDQDVFSALRQAVGEKQ